MNTYIVHPKTNDEANALNVLLKAMNLKFEVSEEKEDLSDFLVLTQTKVTNEPNTEKKLSEKYAGKLPNEIADDLRNYVNQSRAEWNDI